MERPPTRPVMDTINEAVGQWPEESSGYIIVLPAEHLNPLGQARAYVSHRETSHAFQRQQITTCLPTELCDAKLFEDFTEASKVALVCAEYWCGGRWADKIRILEVHRRPPIIIKNNLPISILDALAEL